MTAAPTLELQGVLGRMKAIRQIDRRNRIAVIEPGVTYAELDHSPNSISLRTP